MLKEVLKYIPSAAYAYIGGLTVLSELLPLPLPMHAQEVRMGGQGLPNITFGFKSNQSEKHAELKHEN